MKLLIAIPALNEEASIESIIRRCLAARSYILAKSPITEVEITVVSDGSTDRTVERARQFRDISLIVFDKNRGYGAAIKEAWRRSDADLLGFLDADGTCDPDFFSELGTAIVREGADVVLGCRLNSKSKMPLIRRAGNLIFASILTIFSSKRVRDTASGMRIVRRSSLPKLMPLPDGLHFTPAMSARALLRRDMKIVEIQMPYEERTGRSKLRVGKDGLRFLRVILDSAFLYRPSRPLALAGILCLVVTVALMLMPAGYYLRYRAVTEWMIYRFVVSHLVGTSACLLLCASYLSGRTVRIALSAEASSEGNKPFSERFFSSKTFWAWPVALGAAGVALVIPSFIELVETGATYEHWSRFIAMSFLCSSALILVVTRALDYVLQLVASRLEYLQSEAAANLFEVAPLNRSVSAAGD
ncbi:MAG: glycosyltransferase family 2 protein [Acidobacteriia bacterium]|nr:glycosyltransferase family 2 protein [Terriglobia bacterium]MBV8903466.1 glycosyltransferase family 2 protein [Terriglobia bacterium]MBV9745758.1 glycosyltransferase family 2 protein [Terriglobia bacterium]